MMIFAYNCLTQGQKMLVTRTFVLHLIRSEHERKQSISLIAIYLHKLLLWSMTQRESLMRYQLPICVLMSSERVIRSSPAYLYTYHSIWQQPLIGCDDVVLEWYHVQYINIWLFGAQQRIPDEWKKCHSFDLDGTCNNYVYGIICE